MRVPFRWVARAPVLALSFMIGCGDRLDELLPDVAAPPDASVGSDSPGEASMIDAPADLGQAPDAARSRVLGFLECVVAHDDGTFTAYFNDTNPNPFPVVLAIGPRNAFSPSPADRGQPTAFPPKPLDHTMPEFQVTAPNGTTLVWLLDTASSSATATSKACVPGYGERG